MENTNRKSSQTFWQKVQPALEKTGDICGSIGHVLGIIWNVLVRLRKVFMAVPVGMAAMYLARACRDNLQSVFRFHMLDVLESAKQADLIIRQVEITREVAVYGPLLVTGVCLLLMFFSRRTVFPWLISIFSLAIPVFVLAASYYLPS